MGFRFHTLCARAIVFVLGSMVGQAWSITQSTSTTAFQAVGQGVQVAPDWVLTVSHYAIPAGSSYVNGYGSRTVFQTFVVPGAAYPANDLALMQLVPTGSSTPFLPINADLTWNRAQPLSLPLAATMVSAANANPGPRAYAFTTINSAAQTLNGLQVNYLLSVDPTTHSQGGDSGGGLFAGDVTNSSTLLGLASAQLQDENLVPAGSGFVQPAAYRTWIDQTVATATPGESLLWVSAVPEPTASARLILGLGAVGWVARRRTRRALAPRAAASPVIERLGTLDERVRPTISCSPA